MAKIWAAAFWGELPQATGAGQEQTERIFSTSEKIALYLPMILLGALTLTIGLMAQPFFDLATLAAEQLLNPSGYVGAVLGGKIM